MNNILRFGVSIDEKLLDRFDNLISEKGYVNRSEAIRDLIRTMLDDDDTSDPESMAMGTLTMIYSHEVREISDKLNDIQHNFFGKVITTTHIHLDEHNCLEVLILKGKTRDLKEIANRISSIKTVKVGELVLTAIDKH